MELFDIGSCGAENIKIRISKEGYTTYEDEIDISSSTTPLKIYLDPVSGFVGIRGSVHEAEIWIQMLLINLPLPGVKVSIKKVSSSTTKSQDVTTDSTGNYSFENLPAGLYELIFEKDGYITIRDEIKVTSASTTYNAIMEIISESYAGEGTAEGTIIDALNGQNVGGGISLQITKGINVTGTEPLMTTQTDSRGKYSIKLPAGNYTIWLTDKNSPKKYENDSFIIKVLGLDI